MLFSMLGAFRYQKPKVILFHTDCEPKGEYWKALKQILGDTLKIVKRSPPKKVWGIKIAVSFIKLCVDKKLYVAIATLYYL